MKVIYYPEGADLLIQRVLRFSKKSNKPLYNRIKKVLEKMENDIDGFKEDLKRNEAFPKNKQEIKRLDDIHPGLYELRTPPSDKAAVYRIYFGFDITEQRVILLSAERKKQGDNAKEMVSSGCSLAEYIKKEEKSDEK